MNYNGHSIYHLEEKPRKIMEPESLIISAERTEHFFFQTRTVYIIVNRRSSPDHSKHSLVIFSHYPVGVGTWGKSDQLSECRVSSFVNMLQLNSDYYFWKIGYSFLPTDRNYTIFFFFCESMTCSISHFKVPFLVHTLAWNQCWQSTAAHHGRGPLSPARAGELGARSPLGRHFQNGEASPLTPMAG